MKLRFLPKGIEREEQFLVIERTLFYQTTGIDVLSTRSQTNVGLTLFSVGGDYKSHKWGNLFS